MEQSCKNCGYFVANDKSMRGYGDCLVPDDLVIVPSSYRANNEGTNERYGQDCTFWKAQSANAGKPLTDIDSQ